MASILPVKVEIPEILTSLKNVPSVTDKPAPTVRFSAIPAPPSTLKEPLSALPKVLGSVY